MSSPPTKKFKANSQSYSKKKKSKPLTADEINSFRDVQFLQHSNLFRLQINEMLAALEIKNKTKVRINSWLSDFSSFIKSVPKSKQFQLGNSKWIKEENICLPFKSLSELPAHNGVFKFVPPEDVTMIGSFPLDVATTHSPTVDVALVLPKEFMQTSDLYNGKWLYRRALYLCWVGKALQKNTDLALSLSWIRHCGSPLRPTLQVTPSGKLGTTWKINLYPVPPENFFKLSLISPTKNNVLPSWFFNREKKNDECLPPTPHYNYLCAVDLVMLDHFEYIKDILKHPNWVQGLKLIKVWMKQRNFNQGEGGISSHMMTLAVVDLVKGNKLSTQMSPYLVFRAALLHISQMDWCSTGPTLFEEETSSDRNQVFPSLADFHFLYPVVFVDPSGYVNIAGGVTKQTYLELQQEAKSGLKILELTSSNNFDALFIHRTEFFLASDQTVELRFDNEKLASLLPIPKSESEGVILNGFGDFRQHAFDRAISTLSRGLCDRVDLISVFRGKGETWAFEDHPPELECSLTLGFLVDPRTSAGLLTKGPSADTSEAKDFRAFWGELSSLRRFRDSTFHEAVLWMESEDPVGDRRLIPGKIVKYVAKRHLGLPEGRVHYVAGQAENVLRVPFRTDQELIVKYGTGEEAISLAILSFDRLSKKLRSLDLPLKISTVQSASDVLKHTHVYPPLPFAVPQPYISKKKDSPKATLYSTFHGQSHISYRTPIAVNIFLEISGKWPDDLLAIKAVKVEFMCKLASLLREDGITAVVFPSYLRLLWEGFIFELKICYRREIFLLREPSEVEGMPEFDTEASIELEKEIEILPVLTSSLNNLQSEFPSFSSGARLIRRWVASQLLLPHFPPIVVDLLSASLFLSPHPYQPPNTPHVALLRFLDLVSKTNWKSTPIFVNFRSQFSASDESELTKRFTSTRTAYPHLFVCSPCELRPLTGAADPTAEDLKKRYKLASCWSRFGPSLPILSRMKVLAAAALKTVDKNMWNKAFDFTLVFRPPMNDYDVIICLDEKEITRRSERIGSRQPLSCQRYEHCKGEMLPVVGFDPVQRYLEELKESFDNHALFFNDIHGGDAIGVVWKPNVLEVKEPKINSIEGHKLVGVNDVKQVLNVDAILEEFEILGRGIVTEIKLKS